jgi:hypothetical protein
MDVRHYFVDEAGDLTVFDSGGRSKVGHDGVSRCFLMGVAEIREPLMATARLEALRLELLRDPYFAHAPSLRVEYGKTARAFHAKDDLPEVRWRVFEQLRRLDINVAVALRQKVAIERDARAGFESTGTKWHVHDTYDGLVTQLFVGRFDHRCSHRTTFALRQKSSRNAALVRALERASAVVPHTPDFLVLSSQSSKSIGLQIVDYYLWTVQRLFERAEGRFFAGMAGQFEYVWDLDDTRLSEEGMRYEGTDALLKLARNGPLTTARFE